jgi:uncharacterized oxidoreductase
MLKIEGAVMKLHNSVVLLTGASQGIGRALALQLDQQGCRLLLVGRNRAALESVAGKCAGEPILIVADLGSAAGAALVVRQVAAYSALLDMVINNAGVQQRLDLSKSESTGGFEQEVQLNLLAPLQLNTALLPYLRQPGGVIVNVTSLLALHPKVSTPGYCASKAALRSYTLTLREQLAPLGIAVVEVMPPLVDTAMTAARPLAKKMTTVEMAAAMVRGLQRDVHLIAPGPSRVLLVLNRFFPTLVANMMMQG